MPKKFVVLYGSNATAKAISFVLRTRNYAVTQCDEGDEVIAALTLAKQSAEFTISGVVLVYTGANKSLRYFERLAAELNSKHPDVTVIISDAKSLLHKALPCHALVTKSLNHAGDVYISLLNRERTPGISCPRNTAEPSTNGPAAYKQFFAVAPPQALSDTKRIAGFEWLVSRLAISLGCVPTHEGIIAAVETLKTKATGTQL